MAEALAAGLGGEVLVDEPQLQVLHLDRADVKRVVGAQRAAAHGAGGEDPPAEVLGGDVDHALGPVGLGGEDRLAEVQREADRADGGVLGHERRRQRVARARDEASGLVRRGAQHVGGVADRPLGDHLEVAVLGPVAARHRLDGLVVIVGGEAERPHLAGGMGAAVAGGVDHQRAEHRRGHPAVAGGGGPVLGGDGADDRLVDGVHEQLRAPARSRRGASPSRRRPGAPMALTVASMASGSSSSRETSRGVPYWTAVVPTSRPWSTQPPPPAARTEPPATAAWTAGRSSSLMPQTLRVRCRGRVLCAVQRAAS